MILSTVTRAPAPATLTEFQRAAIQEASQRTQTERHRVTEFRRDDPAWGGFRLKAGHALDRLLAAHVTNHPVDASTRWFLRYWQQDRDPSGPGQVVRDFIGALEMVTIKMVRL